MAKKTFDFPLEGVLKLRRHETAQARQRLARVAAMVQEQQRLLQEARQRLEDLGRRAAAQQAVEPAALRQLDAFRRQAQQAYDEAGQRLEALHREAAAARRQLMQKQQAEEALQTLHDEQKAAFMKEQADAEQAFLDEQALSGFYRKK